MSVSCSWGPLPATGYVVTADCRVCGNQFRAIVDDPQTAARAAVDHRCGTGVIGPTWLLVVPPAARRTSTRRAA